MKKIGQFVYKEHDIILWEDTHSPTYQYGGIVVNDEGREWETSVSTSLDEVITRAITYVDNNEYTTGMRP